MWLVLAFAAHALPCDAKALGLALTEAGPAASAKAYSELAACDPAAAKAAAPDAFRKILAGEAGSAAMIAAVSAGGWQPVRDWLGVQEPDDRARAITKLGQSCGAKDVPAFFVDTGRLLGPKFWADRWYRGLAECRDPGVQELLKAALANPAQDRTQFFGILEAYCRNLGADALPELRRLLGEQKDPEVAALVVNAFSNAAQVGSAAGTNNETAKLAAAAINELAGSLPDRAIDQARTTLLALGAEADSDKLAAVRHKALLQPTGGLLYGVVTTEVATCKKGDVKVELHYATITDTGHTWPDQVAERIAPAVQAAFGLDLASKCKGTGTVESVTPPSPLKDEAAFKAWVATELQAATKKNPGVKIKESAEDPLNL